MKKILFLTNLPAPYTVDFFDEIGKTFELTVLFERKQAKNRKKEWLNKKNNNFQTIHLNGYAIGDELAFCPAVLKYVKQEKYDLCIVGDYSSPTGILAICYLKMRRVSYYIHVDGGLIGKEGAIKRAVKRGLLSGASGYMSSGLETNKYLAFYGADPSRCYQYPFTSIHDKNILQQIKCRSEKKEARESLEYGKNKEEDFIVLSVGNIIHRKGFDILIEAAKILPSTVGVYIIGGAATEELKMLMNSLEVKNVHFLSFMPSEIVRKYMECADLFVLPTRYDVWGLVVNEAMAAGLPVITTEMCVAGRELIREGTNGYLIPNEDSKVLSEKICKLIDNPQLLAQMSIKSRDIISDYTIEKMAREYEKGISHFFDKECKYEKKVSKSERNTGNRV